MLTLCSQQTQPVQRTIAVLQDSFSLEASLLGSSGARQVMRNGRSTAFGTTLPSMSSSKPLVLPSTGNGNCVAHFVHM